MNPKNPTTAKLLIPLTVAVLTLTLFFGLDPKGFHLSNNVSWISGKGGVRFGKDGIAYADNVFRSFGRGEQASVGLSLEIVLRPDNIDDKRFKFILVLHDGDDSGQLLVGQWRSSIIVMNGDDYDGRRHIKKLGVRDALLTQQARLVTITSGKEGTRIYLNNKVAAAAKDLFLHVPAGREGVRLVVGNSVYGRHFWSGDIFGLAVYETALSATEVTSHFEKWSGEQQFAFARQSSPRALYLFDETKGGQARDRAGGANDLEIPQRFKILKREMLDASWREIRLNSSFIQDVFLNIAGFLPLGFLLNAMFAGLEGAVRKHGALMSVMVCFVLSLSIEIVQAWMPLRSSQTLDLLMNTLGAFLGVMAYRYSTKYLARLKLCASAVSARDKKI